MNQNPIFLVGNKHKSGRTEARRGSPADSTCGESVGMPCAGLPPFRAEVARSLLLGAAAHGVPLTPCKVSTERATMQDCLPRSAGAFLAADIAGFCFYFW